MILILILSLILIPLLMILMFPLLSGKESGFVLNILSPILFLMILSPSYRAFVLFVSSVSIPQDWKEAYLDSKWKAAMVEEMRALAKNEI